MSACPWNTARTNMSEARRASTSAWVSLISCVVRSTPSTSSASRPLPPRLALQHEKQQATPHAADKRRPAASAVPCQRCSGGRRGATAELPHIALRQVC